MIDNFRVGRNLLKPDSEFPGREKATSIADRQTRLPLFVVLAAVASPSSFFHLDMRTQVFSTLLRTRPTNVSRVAPRLARSSSTQHQETFESFTERYVNFFQSAEDLFEVQRGLNNCFAHDLVPAPAVVESAVRASRRVNDYATAVRIFEGIKEKVENQAQYQAYLDELKPVREELGAFLFARIPPPLVEIYIFFGSFQA
jgi:cytochrome c oxidase subunit 5a